MDIEKAKDQIRAGAWALASAKSRSDAARFLEQVAASLRDADWKND